MLQSVAAHCPGAHIFVLCMDKKCEEILDQIGLDYITCIPLATVETEALLAAKQNRGVAEYCWTLSSNFTWFVVNQYPSVDFITYLDADLLFYSPLQPLFDEIGDSSIAIIEHRFSPRLKDQEVNGRFCVEWVSFRRDEQGMACLDQWRQQCIEWCYYRLEAGKMGDQKYLDRWPDTYSKCHILVHPGAGIAPWNYSQYQFAVDSAQQITIDGAPLIFYHFHQFQLLENKKFDRLSTFYTSECPEPDSIYQAYEEKILKAIGLIRSFDPTFRGGIKTATALSSRRFAQRFLPRWIKTFLKKLIRY